MDKCPSSKHDMEEQMTNKTSQLTDEIVGLRGYENLKEYLGEKLGLAIYDLVNEINAQNAKDYDFLQEILYYATKAEENRQDSGSHETVKQMLTDWINELKLKTV